MPTDHYLILVRIRPRPAVLRWIGRIVSRCGLREAAMWLYGFSFDFPFNALLVRDTPVGQRTGPMGADEMDAMLDRWIDTREIPYEVYAKSPVCSERTADAD